MAVTNFLRHRWQHKELHFSHCRNRFSLAAALSGIALYFFFWLPLTWYLYCLAFSCVLGCKGNKIFAGEQQRKTLTETNHSEPPPLLCHTSE
jgi:hypothetical protein